MKQVSMLLTAVLSTTLSFISHAQWHVSTGTSKYVVLEESTTTGGGFCPDGHQEIVQTIIPSIPHAIVMSWHGDTTDPLTIPGDPFCFGSGYVTGFLGSGVIDRATIGGDFHHPRPWSSLISARTALAPKFMVEMNSSYNPTSRELTVTVTGTALASMTGNWNFNVFVLEDSVSSAPPAQQTSHLTSFSSACNGMPCWFNGLGTLIPPSLYAHMNVVRAVLATGGSIWGDAAFVNPTVGDYESRTYTYTLPPTFTATNVKVVGVVQKSSAALSDREIENAISSRVSLMPISGSSVSSSTFTAYATSTCSGLAFSVNTTSFSSGMSIYTEYGDGATGSETVTSGGSTAGSASFGHSYATPGTYTIKHKLLSGTTVIDSVTYSFEYRFCNTLSARVYFDGNGTCDFEPGTSDRLFNSPVSFAIDSNGVPVDTIHCTSGFYYTAFGVPGDVYTTRLISSPTSYAMTCPTTGVRTNTLGSTSATPTNDFGFQCATTTSSHELQVHSATRAFTNRVNALASVYNNYCSPTAATLTMHFSPRYAYSYATPTPTSVSGTELTWDLGMLASIDPMTNISVCLKQGSAGFLPTGDTVHTYYSIGPWVGDADTSNNDSYEVDTAIGSYDPNYVEVNPGNCIDLGTTSLEYTVGFENMGGDTAHNIYVLDTIDNNLDFASLKPVIASHNMFIYKYTAGGHNIVKFDFPNIMLPDSSHHDVCHGMFKYTINTNNMTAYGTQVPCRVGIYFDANPVVMTNTATNTVCFPAMINEAKIGSGIKVYPNPATDVLVIETSDNSKNGQITISNIIGQQLITAPVVEKATDIDISKLPGGMYYVRLKNSDNTISKTVKFTKL